MVTETNQYQPDYAVPPGWVLEERLAAHDLAHAEFARRCGRSPKLISEIIAGKAPIEPKTALQFEKVLGIDASIWLGIESDYRLHGARLAEREAAAASAAWANSFPITELVKRGLVDKPANDADRVSGLLAFFGVASRETWHLRYQGANVAYRHSPSFESDDFALATWRRLAETQAEEQSCGDYRESAFREALRRVRELTCSPVGEALEEARRVLNEAGVSLALVKPLPKVRVSGAAWWLTPNRPILALSARHLRDDHLWFSFFHEAAHILLHSKKTVFIDGTDGVSDKIDSEADTWAAGFLIPRAAWRPFITASTFNALGISEFAKEQGIPPGIVVGRLQHEGLVPWRSRLNSLKVKLEWKSPSPSR